MDEHALSVCHRQKQMTGEGQDNLLGGSWRMNADKCVLLCSGSAHPSLWVQCPALCQGEGGAAAPQLLLGEESGLSITALILLGWPEQLGAQQGCRAGQAGPGLAPPSALPPPLCRDTHTAQQAAL